MLSTKPDFIQGDHLSLKHYLSALIHDKRLLFTSRWTWWKKTTAFWIIPLLLADFAMFVALLYQDIRMGEGVHWMLIGSMMVLPFIFFLPPIWVGNYYYSFISSHNITRKLETFIKDYLPEAQHVRRLSQTNYILSSDGLEFEVAYSMIPTKKSKRGVPSHYVECILTCLYYMPDPKRESEILDDEGRLQETFLDDWQTYCEGKESCKYLYLDDYAVFAFYPYSKLKDREQVQQTMEQIHYLIHRYGLLPLYKNQIVSEGIKGWLSTIDEATPTDIVALNIGLFETATGYSLYLIGSKTYDAADDDWACNEDYVPEEKYYEIAANNLGSSDGEDLQKMVQKIVEEYAKERVENEESLFYHKIVTIGFDEGELHRIF